MLNGDNVILLEMSIDELKWFSCSQLFNTDRRFEATANIAYTSYILYLLNYSLFTLLQTLVGSPNYSCRECLGGGVGLVPKNQLLHKPRFFCLAPSDSRSAAINHSSAPLQPRLGKLISKYSGANTISCSNIQQLWFRLTHGLI